MGMSPLAQTDLARALFEENGDAMFLVDPDSDRVIDANRTALRLTGFPKAELTGCRFADLFRFERAGDTRDLEEAAGKTTHFHGQDGYFLRTKSDPGWLAASLTVTRLHARPKTLALITARDDTDRRAALAAVQQNEERFRALVEKSSDGIMVVGASGLIQYASPSAGRIVGLLPFEMENRDTFDLVHPDDRARVRALFALALAHPGREVPARFRGRRGNSTWGATDMVAVNRLDDPNVKGVVFNYRDVTEQVRAENALSRQHSLLRTLIDSIPDLICFKDRRLRFLGGNPAFERLAGRPMSELIGRDCLDVFSGEWAIRLRALEAHVMESGKPEGLSLWVKDASGDNRLLDLIVAPAGVHEGEPTGLTIVGRDLTERKRLEDQVRDAQKMEAIGQLAGGVAHDFNNLLTVILGNLELAREYTRGSDTEDLLVSTETAARRAADLTGQLLGFARRRPMVLAPLRVSDIVDEIAGLMRRTIDPRIKLQVYLRPQMWLTRADAGQLHQVLMNLCLNARDAMPHGGTLTLTTGNVSLDSVSTTLSVGARPGRFVRVRVADTGTGIPDEVKNHIFEPFFTTKELGHGTGLGLAVVFGIVQAHGGWITCDSVQGKGTVFDVYLPMHDTLDDAEAQPISKNLTIGDGERILFVDDEPLLRDLAKNVLGQIGYQTTLAQDGLDAISQIEKSAEPFDLIVMDLTMPNLSGREAMVQIRARHPHLPIILSSGYSSEHDDVVREATYFLEKPFSPTELARVIREVLDQHHPSRGAKVTNANRESVTSFDNQEDSWVEPGEPVGS